MSNPQPEPRKKWSKQDASYRRVGKLKAKQQLEEQAKALILEPELPTHEVIRKQLDQIISKWVF